ncbi:FhaA domain-containing protein [Dactylosporangium sp. NPDC049742]|uniref:FhaA domain-containing protein n=1 Tax=Dactylosporangium sp. NPDC049742 TaxID=3154737 RepID=UPI00342AAAF6
MSRGAAFQELVGQCLQSQLLDAAEVADALWLATYMYPQQRRPPAATHVPEPPPAPAAEPPDLEPVYVAPPPVVPLQTPTVALHPVHRQEPPAASGTAEAGPTSGEFARAPGVAGLHDGLDLSRAMRPMRRRVPAPGLKVIDEEASAVQSAASMTLVAVERHATERWLEVALVVDDGPGMVVWERVAHELARLLERQAAFRNVRSWRLRDGRAGLSIVPLSASGSITPRNSSELLDPTGRRLVLLLTDGVGASHHQARVLRLLQRCRQVGPTAVINALPKSMWHRTGFDIRPVWQRSSGEGGGRPRLRAASFAGSRPTVPGTLIPVLELTPNDLSLWARMLAGQLTDEVGGYALDPAQTGLADPEDPVPAVPSPAERVRQFRASVSAQAFELATQLSAVPLTLSIMRLVQASMLLDSRPCHLAEFYLGDLIQRLAPPQPGEDPDTVIYEFRPGVREELLGLLSRMDVIDTLDVVRQVSAVTAALFGGSLDFRALVDTGTGRVNITAENEPFARVAATVLRSLGGPYEEMARLLTDRLARDTAHARRLPEGRVAGRADVPATSVVVESVHPEVFSATVYDLVDGPVPRIDGGEALTRRVVVLGLRFEADEESPDLTMLQAMLEREAEARRIQLPSGTVVAPNRYVIEVAPEVLAAYDQDSLKSTAAALARYTAWFIGARGWQVVDDVFIDVWVKPGLDARVAVIIPEIYVDPARGGITASEDTAQEHFEERAADLLARIRETPGLNVDPIAVLRSMQVAARQQRRSSSSGLALVPNRYVVTLPADDYQRMGVSVAQDLAQALADAQVELIHDVAWSAPGDIIVEVVMSAGLQSRRHLVEAEFYQTGSIAETGQTPLGNALRRLRSRLRYTLGHRVDTLLTGSLQPAYVLTQLDQCARSEHWTGADGTNVVPNRYEVICSEHDFGAVRQDQGLLVAELSRALSECIAEYGWNVVGDVLVTFRPALLMVRGAMEVVGSTDPRAIRSPRVPLLPAPQFTFADNGARYEAAGVHHLAVEVARLLGSAGGFIGPGERAQQLRALDLLQAQQPQLQLTDSSIAYSKLDADLWISHAVAYLEYLTGQR